MPVNRRNVESYVTVTVDFFLGRSSDSVGLGDGLALGLGEGLAVGLSDGAGVGVTCVQMGDGRGVGTAAKQEVVGEGVDVASSDGVGDSMLNANADASPSKPA